MWTVPLRQKRGKAWRRICHFWMYPTIQLWMDNEFPGKKPKEIALTLFTVLNENIILHFLQHWINVSTTWSNVFSSKVCLICPNSIIDLKRAAWSKTKYKIFQTPLIHSTGSLLFCSMDSSVKKMSKVLLLVNPKIPAQVVSKRDK